jgi:hypothetical protein
VRYTGRNIAIVFGFILCFFLAAGSVIIHRQATVVLGNLCEQTTDNPHGYCFGPAPAGGWPFAFLYDNPSVSVRGSLDFPEDELRPGWFLADVAAFSALPALIAVAPHLRRRRRSAGSSVR